MELVNYNNDIEKVKNISPIFIVGLPRSGSTLIEALLTSGKDKVISIGENHSINMSILDQIGGKIYKKNFNFEKFKFQIDYPLFKESVLKKYEEYGLVKEKTKTILLDKSLENFFNIDLILKVFPNAKFLHCNRNLVDEAIAIYQSMLFQLSWTHKIEDILNYMDNYIKIINYFEKQYPKNVMNVKLEKLTIDKEKIVRKIFEFCNLKWDEKSLEFYKRKDLNIRTLSNIQIRNQITEYNLKKYKPYNYLLEGYQKKYNWINLN